MKKETGALIAGMILGMIALLGIQMFKEGNTDTISRLKQNNRKVVKKLPKAVAQSPVQAVSVPTVMDSTSRLGLASNDSLIDLKPKPIVKEDEKFEEHWMYFDNQEMWVTSKEEHLSLDAKGWKHEKTDSNNNPIAQNPLIMPRSSMGARY